MVFLRKNDSKRASVVVGALKDIKIHSDLMNSITFDNGTEFAHHTELGVDTYFCDPGKPWQKGAIENVNGILRRYIDYRVSAESVTQELLDSVAYQLNNKPRKILGFLTPNEVFEQCCRQKY